MSSEIKQAEKVFLASGRSQVLFRQIVASGLMDDAVGALAEGDAADADQLVADYYAACKATTDDE